MRVDSGRNGQPKKLAAFPLKAVDNIRNAGLPPTDGWTSLDAVCGGYFFLAFLIVFFAFLMVFLAFLMIFFDFLPAISTPVLSALKVQVTSFQVTEPSMPSLSRHLNTLRRDDGDVHLSGIKGPEALCGYGRSPVLFV
ncbi:MAG: hypothetical protein HN403_05705 [Rhodospirillales bacterium]|nr:hypothetical protein [Rhodospirillales bacterium]